LSRELYDGFIDAGLLLQLETARLAAKKRTNEDLYRLFTVIGRSRRPIPEQRGAHRPGLFIHKAVTISQRQQLLSHHFHSMEATIKACSGIIKACT
jgi:DNA-binding FadR family transcriptional regulator